MRHILVVAALLFAPTALAQQPNPCSHSADSVVVLGGMDLVELKCRLVVDDDRIAYLDKQLRAVETSRIIATNDLALAKQAAEQREKDLSEWFKGWCGDRSGCTVEESK